MALRTYVMELRADFLDEKSHEVLTTLMRDAARNALATAMMLKDKTDPRIILQVGDMFEGNKELEISEGGE